VDVPVPAEQAFVFTDGAPTLVRAWTLKEFTEALSKATIESVKGYLDRHDFSRWIDQVFGDYTLAAQIEDLENRDRSRQDSLVRDAIIQLIAERYTLSESELQQ
jgi:hypothetical protein